jgi:23S rRNA (uracil1939-C5)-methyltransferase
VKRRRRRSANDASLPAGDRPTATLDLTSLAFGGEALGRLDGRVVFVPFALPGEKVLIEISEVHRDFSRAEVLEVLEPSPQRVQPPCQYFGECGGCSLQHAQYPTQLEFKRQVVAEQLRRIGHFESAAELVLPTIGMLNPWTYRNHARFSVGRRLGELCFTRRGTRQLMRIEHCLIVHPAIDAAAAEIQDKLVGFRGHQVALRVGANTGGLLVNPPLPDAVSLPSGQEFLEEMLFDRRFRIASPAFFQVNTRREPRPIPAGLSTPPWPLPVDGLSMAEVIALVVHDRLALNGSELLVDAYSGVGTFAVLLARSAGRVIGIEESTAAVQDARYNARDLDNVEFLAGKSENLLPALAERPEAVVLDPARVGCDAAVLSALIDLQVPRVAYVSCDPSTLARDLAALVAGGFHLHDVQPIDMFPQTFHVEAVAALTFGNQTPSKP